MLLADQNRRTRIGTPWVTIGLIGVCTGIFLLELAGMPMPDVLVFFPGALQVLPDDPRAWIGVLGHVLLHGGFLHLFGNMLALWVFGDNVEDALGHGRFLAFFLACGAAGAAGFALTARPGAGLIGASGAIAGVMAAYLLLYPRARVAMLVLKGIPVAAPASWFVGLWFTANVVHAAGLLGPGPADEPPTAWFAHLGGFVAGLALTFLARPAGVALFQQGPAGDVGGGWLWGRVWDLGPSDGADSWSAAAVAKALLFLLLASFGLLFAS